MKTLYNLTLTFLLIAAWTAPIVIAIRELAMVDSEGVPFYLKATNTGRCSHCNGRWISVDGGRKFYCLDCHAREEVHSDTLQSSVAL